jgi:AcrR family transcriptional regulator
MKTAPSTRPRKQPTQDRAAATVEALLTATAQVLVQEGYDHASTNKIARRAGVSIGSLYQYYPSKEALVLALAKRNGEQEISLIQKKLLALKDLSLSNVVRELVTVIIEAHRIDPELQKVFITQVPQIGGLSIIRETNRHAARMFSDYVASIFPQWDEEALDLRVFIAMHAAEGLIHQALLERPDYLSQPLFVDELTTLVVSYLEAKRG